MKKNLRKGSQLKLTNLKNAGRKAIHDKGIRHSHRERLVRASGLHLTIKLIKADMQNKTVLKILRYAIMKARKQNLKIVHYALEHNHIHLYAEAVNNADLSKGMKAFGVTLVKKINRYQQRSGSLYKHRYHLRILKSATEVKNVINYILKNGMKHRKSKSPFDLYNSALVLHDFKIIDLKVIKADIQKSLEYQHLKCVLDELNLYRRELNFLF